MFRCIPYRLTQQIFLLTLLSLLYLVPYLPYFQLKAWQFLDWHTSQPHSSNFRYLGKTFYLKCRKQVKVLELPCNRQQWWFWTFLDLQYPRFATWQCCLGTLKFWSWSQLQWLEESFSWRHHRQIWARDWTFQLRSCLSEGSWRQNRITGWVFETFLNIRIRKALFHINYSKVSELLSLYFLKKFWNFLIAIKEFY